MTKITSAPRTLRLVETQKYLTFLGKISAKKKVSEFPKIPLYSLYFMPGLCSIYRLLDFVASLCIFSVFYVFLCLGPLGLGGPCNGQKI